MYQPNMQQNASLNSSNIELHVHDFLNVGILEMNSSPEPFLWQCTDILAHVPAAVNLKKRSTGRLCRHTGSTP